MLSVGVIFLFVKGYKDFIIGFVNLDGDIFIVLLLSVFFEIKK